MIYLVEYSEQDNFTGFGGHIGKNNKLIGITDKPNTANVLKPGKCSYDENDIFDLLFDYYIYTGKEPVWKEDGSIELNNQVSLKFIKQIKLRELSNKTNEYIQQNYSIQKQNSDIVDIHIWTNYLYVNGLSQADLLNSIFTSVHSFYSGNKLDKILQQLGSSLNNQNNLSYWDLALEQILKSYIRIEWVNKVKERYRLYKKHIITTKDIDNVENTTFNFSDLVFPKI